MTNPGGKVDKEPVRKRGYFGIGMFEPKTIDNLGGLVRSAYCFGADFVFTIGNRYHKQPTDTADATRHMPLFHYTDMEDFVAHAPDVDIVGIEIVEGAKNLEDYKLHPERAMYILGGEDRTLPESVLQHCQSIRKIDTRYCLNVASAATVVMYDRNLKQVKHHETTTSGKSLEGQKGTLSNE